MSDAAPVTGRFLVTAVDEGGVVLRDVERGRVHALDVTRDHALDVTALDPGAVVVGTVEPVPPLDAAWTLADVDRRFRVTVEAVDESPTAHARTVAPDEPGDLARTERAGDGELHVLAVPTDGTAAAVEDLLADADDLRARAARLGVERVEIRSEPGLVCVRYLP